MMRSAAKVNILKRVISLFRKEFIWIAVFSMIANVLLLTPTLYMLQLYGRVMVSGSMETLVVVTIIMVFFFAMMTVAEWLRSRLLVRVGIRLDEDLNSLVFNASFESYLRNASRKAVEALSNLVTVRQFMTGNGVFAFFDLPWTPVYIIVTFMLHPFLGWLSVLFAIIQIGITYMSNRAAMHDIERDRKSLTDSNAFVQGKLRNVEAVHAMGMVDSMRDRWLNYHESYLGHQGYSQELQHRRQSVSKFVRYCMQSFTLGAGALLVINGELSAGSMIAANVLMARALQPLDMIIVVWQQFVQAKVAIQELEQLLTDFPEREQGFDHGSPSGAVRLDGLTATVENRPKPILNKLSADIPSGSVVVVMGPSGAGKSTLARCIVGVWPDVQGSVMLDGKPITSWDRSRLGPYIGYLPQDIELFDGSIAENIARFGDVDPNRVIEAATRTGIHDMVLRFPKGYDTQIGEAGGMLSGGQRQRIGLARAIYGNPSLIVLDEPNANLDDAGERSLIQAVLDLKKQGKTVFLISHRTNVLGVADRVMVLRNGTIDYYDTRDKVLAAMHVSGHVKPAFTT